MSDHIGEELVLLNAVTNAQRRLLGLRHREEATTVLIELVRALGGRVVPVDLRPLEAIPLDLTFGERETLVPAAQPGTPVRARLERILPPLVEQARGIVDLLEAAGRLDPHGALDLLTGLGSRRHLARVLERSAEQDRLLGFVIDHYPAVVARHGRVRTDGAMRQLGLVLGDHVHPADHAARVGAGAVAVHMVRPGSRALDQLRRTVLTSWADRRPFDAELIWCELGGGLDVSETMHELDRRLDNEQASGKR